MLAVSAKLLVSVEIDLHLYSRLSWGNSRGFWSYYNARGFGCLLLVSLLFLILYYDPLNNSNIEYVYVNIASFWDYLVAQKPFSVIQGFS
jgi:hypothetical protein